MHDVGRGVCWYKKKDQGRERHEVAAVDVEQHIDGSEDDAGEAGWVVKPNQNNRGSPPTGTACHGLPVRPSPADRH